MTRPRVPDDKRQRTAQACDSCKRRKQKCNGLNPCQTCVKRRLTCAYTPNNGADHSVGESAGSPTKRRHIETSPQSIPAALDSAVTSPPQRSASDTKHLWDEVPIGQSRKGASSVSTSTGPHPPTSSGYDHARKGSMSEQGTLPDTSHTNGQAEEATIYTETRMLQDQTGRLLYIGDASTLSILQLIRIIVENTAGTDMGSPFINDPKRHRILESIIDFPENTKVPSILPDKQTADILIESYFINTCGLIEVFDRKAFIDGVETVYRDPLSAGHHSLCHLFLVLALGLLLAAPTAGSRQEAIIHKLLAAKMDRAELFFRSARSMCDPDSGFEDADFWSVQALSLMTVYMLAVSKRNRAYAYLGMAVRSAYALGLHREETMNDFIFTAVQMTVRRNLWKTLFILDRFLAASLGRPTAISEDDCSCKIMPDNDISSPLASGEPSLGSVHARSLDSCVRSCHAIGVTLKVFSSRKISTSMVQGIVDLSNAGGQGPHTTLQRRQPKGPSIHPAAGIANLHQDLLSLHSLILLTRQLFIMHNWKLEEQRSGLTEPSPMYGSPMARYSEACVIASYHTIHLLQRAREAGYLPRRNPFIIYFLFAASLVVFMNQFASLYRTNAYAQTVTDGIAIMKFCAETDPQARRVLEIMEKFAKVVAKWTKDHTYNAPDLSGDLSGLYSHMPSPHLSHEPSSLGSMPSPAEPETPRILNAMHQTTLPGPAVPLPPLSELLIPHPPNAVMDTRMNGISPSHAPTLNPPIDPRAGVSSHPIVDHDPMNEDIEFDFDGLWNNWINHVVPVSAMGPGITPMAPHFSPVATNAAPDTFGGTFTLPPEARISPAAVISGTIPLYHSTNFG
ncbi:fungal-specific transcription factor domain-containing protein [Immersiella caudata]|uniref:Fungal-specific transcription factor domain-containing protein n=1 Tax=Immersiella caudata TaxID=314043 RepID=A0AA39WXF4_9PEZI|nr:fungal-specific transcription factor domain-containing protein [Immersiella caudata]